MSRNSVAVPADVRRHRHLGSANSALACGWQRNNEFPEHTDGATGELPAGPIGNRPFTAGQASGATSSQATTCVGTPFPQPGEQLGHMAGISPRSTQRARRRSESETLDSLATQTVGRSERPRSKAPMHDSGATVPASRQIVELHLRVLRVLRGGCLSVQFTST